MLDFFRDPLWQFIGAVFALGAIIISIVVYLRQRQLKAISYEVIAIVNLLSVNTNAQLRDKITVLYEGQQIENLYLFFIRIANAGNQPILVTDYVRPISIRFIKTGRMLNVQLHSRKPYSLKVLFEVSDHAFTIEPVMLNSGDTFIIKALIKDYAGWALNGRIVGVKDFISEYTRNSRRLVALIAGVTSVLAAFALILTAINSQIGTLSMAFIVGGMSTLVVSLWNEDRISKRQRQSLADLTDSGMAVGREH